MLGLDRRSKKWLFVFAHMDDETILAYGTASKLAALGNEVRIAVCCGAGRKDADQASRAEVFNSNVREIGAAASWRADSIDMALVRKDVDSFVEKQIEAFSPEVVATHSIASLHPDHRLVAERVLTACRSTQFSTTEAVLAACSPADALGHGQLGSFQPDFFVDTSAWIDAKKAALERYAAVGEIPGSLSLDARSVAAILANDKLHGMEMATEACETWKLVFAKT